ncbi:MAG: RecX family transcriptional regulator [Candidatus Ancillula sp.]|nr:RecX family transcriptional regulator [Candidatus Ancillula sp.]
MGNSLPTKGSSDDEFFKDANKGQTEDTAFDKAQNYALRLLSARGYSCLGLRKKLSVHNFSQFSDQIIEHFKENGLLNDVKYAEDLAYSEISHAKGEWNIRQKLREKGIDQEVIDEVVPRILAENLQESEILQHEFISRKIKQNFPDGIFERKTPEDYKLYDKLLNRILSACKRRGIKTSFVFEEIDKIM